MVVESCPDFSGLTLLAMHTVSSVSYLWIVISVDILLLEVQQALLHSFLLIEYPLLCLFIEHFL